jgi:hypothetical protein
MSMYQPQYHYRQHPNDRPQPFGHQLVRIDRGGVETPLDKRTYVQIRAGYGEGVRAMHARGGQPNWRKLAKKLREQKYGRMGRYDLALPKAPKIAKPPETEVQKQTRYRSLGRRGLRDLLKGKSYDPHKH